MKAWETTFRKTHAVAKKRANSIFGTTHVAHAEDEEEVEEEDRDRDRDRDRDGGESHGSGRGTCEADRVLANGDRYTGHWSDNLPHGSYGRYVWSDGCAYVGEWFKGKMMGRGRFSWPSGASYEGEFKGGYMHGRGMYRGSNGETHKGSWMMNLKHGHGVKEYANGDSYEGDWCRGLQEGVGKYQWKDGNRYVGEWKNGAFCGKGKLVWSNGNVFDGHWEDGLPKGNGTYRWCDGSFYVGNWSKDPKEQNGTYYPSGTSPEGNLEWDHQDVFNIDLRECKVCPGEKISMLPSQKKIGASRSWSKSVDNTGVAPRRMSVDVVAEREFSRMRMLEGSGSASCDSLGRNVGGSGREVDEARLHDVNHTRGSAIRIPKVARRQGETISRGHRNYELMLNLQLGIRHSVGRPGPPASLNLKSSAFDPKEKVWTKFPPEGSKHTPPHQSCEFKWKDYCPLVFRTLRMLFKVDAADYMLSICGNDALRELSSPGKSGSFFYLTNDDRYMIKTMKKAEAKVLIRMLSAYYNHVRAFENTLVTKFYGLHCVKLHGPSQKKVRFIIMGNLFCSQYTIHRRFDLKGSSLGRMTDKAEADIDPTTILKDLDLNFVFRLQRTWFQEFRRQIDKDCEFLEQERIMDYSLLVGLHFRETTNSGELIQSGAHSPSENGDTDAESIPRLSRADMDQLLLDPAGWASIRLGVNMPARVERTVRKTDCESQLVGQPTGECYDVVMFFGVIDILQDYDITKKLEHAYKSIHYDPTSISAVDPKLYARRFREFILKIFTEDT